MSYINGFLQANRLANLVRPHQLTNPCKVAQQRPLSTPARGLGYLAGTHPNGLTKLEGEPVSAEVRALWRDDNGETLLVASTTSEDDGTWMLHGLNPDLKYDVVMRHAGYNDGIVSGVTPKPYLPMVGEGGFTVAPNGYQLNGSISLGGVAPYAARVISGAAPPGISFAPGNTITATGSCKVAGDYEWTLEIRDKVGRTGLFNCSADNMLVGIPENGLIAFYTMDNLVGSTLTSATNSNHGTITGCTSTAGKFGNALNFDGTNDYVDIPHHADFNGDLTISMWVRAGFSASSLRGLIYKSADTGFTMSFGSNIDVDGKVGVSISDGANLANAVSTTIMSASVTNHILLRIEDKTCSIWVNGVQEGSATLPNPRVTSPAAVTLGRTSLASTAQRYLVGWMDQVRIYKRALTPVEIATLASES